LSPELRALYQRLSQKPNDLDAALTLARHHIAQARALADPREYGRAEAVLRPWWNDPHPPDAEVLRLRATIRQFNHEFAPARADLAAYLAVKPMDASARLMQATVAVVVGDYTAARNACLALPPRIETTVRVACGALAESFLGNAPKGYVQLRASAIALGASTSALEAWAFSTAADVASRAGREGDMLDLLQRAHAAAPGDALISVQLADCLLDLDRPKEVIPLTRDRPDHDGLLLRLGRAQKALGDPDFPKTRAVLQSRFEAELARGTTPHLREAAYFHHYLTGDDAAALAAARRNWELQREPIDARLLLESALGARDLDAAAPARQWVHEHAAGDVRLARLAAEQLNSN
jgi:hypothetical protein